MPVDVVNSHLNLKDLVIDENKTKEKNFDPDRDILQSDWDKIINKIKTGNIDPHQEIDLITAFAYLAGKVKKEDIHKNIWDLLVEGTGIRTLACLYILEPEKITHSYSRTNITRESHYERVKETFKDETFEPLNDLRVILFGTIFRDLFNNDLEFKEYAYNKYRKVLQETDIDSPSILLACAAFRITFPQDDLWVKMISDSNWSHIKYLPPNNDLYYIAKEGLGAYIVCADRVEVSDNGLVVVFREKTEDKQDLLPERRKY